jgi:hypothetical protein
VKDIYSQNKTIIFREEGSEAMLFNPDTADIMVINTVGRIVWSLCDGVRSVHDIASSLEKEFNVSYEQAKKDVNGFITTLVQGDFLLSSE